MISPIHHRRHRKAAGGLGAGGAGVAEGFGQHGVQRICTNSGQCQSVLITGRKGWSLPERGQAHPTHPEWPQPPILELDLNLTQGPTLAALFQEQAHDPDQAQPSKQVPTIQP